MTMLDERFLHNEHPSLRHCWHPVALESEVGPGPLAVTLLGERYVVADLDGTLVAFGDRCPHRGAPLSAGTIEGASLRCPYHGYRFDTGGQCVEIPSQRPDVAIPPRADVACVARVETRHGIVWIAPDEPVNAVPAFGSEAGVSDIAEVVAAPPMTFQVPAGLLLENALDQAHVPFVHSAPFGAPEDASNVTVTRDDWSFVATYEQSGAANDEVFAHDTVVFGYALPFVVWGRFEYPDGSAMSFLSALQPVDAHTTRAFGAFVAPDGVAEMPGFFDAQVKITEEDRWMLEQLVDPGLPLDVTAEVHTTADRPGVELRRIFNELITLTGSDAGSRG